MEGGFPQNLRRFRLHREMIPIQFVVCCLILDGGWWIRRGVARRGPMGAEHGFDEPDEVVKKHTGAQYTTSANSASTDHAAEDREMERREIADLEGVVPCQGGECSRRFPATLGNRDLRTRAWRTYVSGARDCRSRGIWSQRPM